jgi:hypothetical protein
MFGFIRRMIINNSLEKKSNALKARYNNFENELYAVVDAVVKETTRDNTVKLNAMIENLNSKLKDEQDFLQDISQPMKEYIKLSFEVNLFYEQRKLVYTRMNEISNRILFLNSDIDNIKLEIEELKESVAKLMVEADIQSFMELLELNNIEIDKDVNLVSIIQEHIDKSILYDEKTALSKLKSLIRERLKIEKDIRFFEWAIEQKNKKIKSNEYEIRRCIKISKNINEYKINLNNKIDEIEAIKLKLAKSIHDRINRFSPQLISVYSQLQSIYDIEESNRSDDDWTSIKVLLSEKNMLLYNHFEHILPIRWNAIYETLQQYNLKLITKPKELPDKQGIKNES